MYPLRGLPDFQSFFQKYISGAYIKKGSLISSIENLKNHITHWGFNCLSHKEITKENVFSNQDVLEKFYLSWVCLPRAIVSSYFKVYESFWSLTRLIGTFSSSASHSKWWSPTNRLIFCRMGQSQAIVKK